MGEKTSKKVHIITMWFASDCGIGSKKGQKKCVKNLAGLKKGRNFALAKRERHRPAAGAFREAERTLTRLRQTRSSTRRVVKTSLRQAGNR